MIKSHLVRHLIATTIVGIALVPTRSECQTNTEQRSNSNTVSKSTPHLVDGHPDLNGVWHRFMGGVNTKKEGESVVFVFKRPATSTKVSVAPAAPTAPEYKPEFQKRVHYLDDHSNDEDPAFHCLPPGIPRLGPPNQIIQTAREIVFLYSDLNGNFWRVIPTDGSAIQKSEDRTYNGDSVGHWEGDTLVIESSNFTDETWLGDRGLIHSLALRVIERLRREGDVVQYQVTVDDPMMLVKPWTMTPRTLGLQAQRLDEAPPCMNKDSEHLINSDHHDNPR